MTTLLHPHNITRADLDWWLELAPTLTWTFAKTYAETAPHSYVVAGKTAGMTPDDYVRAASVIRTFGQPAKYYSMTNIYLASVDGSLKWWSMDKRVSDTTLINQAATDRVYGEQDAPTTFSRYHSVYDEVATDYDLLRSSADGDAKTGLLGILADLHDLLGDNPTVLDVGCGTGAVLDLGVTTPDRYTGVDPSQAMLNELLMKYNRQRFAGISPSRVEDALDGLQRERFDLVIAAFGSASYFSPDALARLAGVASGAIVLMGYADGFVPAIHDGRLSTSRAASQALRSVAESAGVAVQRVGRFDVVVVAMDVHPTHAKAQPEGAIDALPRVSTSS